MTLRREITQFIEESLLRGDGEIDPEESLIERGVIDSIGLMHLMGFIEDRTGMKIPDDMVRPDNFQSVAAMEKLVEELRSARDAR